MIRFRLLMLFLILAVTGWVSISYGTYLRDDCYITFRVARNFAEGNGLVYNVGERHLASSAPLYAIVLGVIGKVIGTDNIPVTAVVLSWLAFVGIAFMAYLIIERGATNPIAGIIAGMIAVMAIVTSPVLATSIGNEMLPQAALVLCGLYCIAVKRSGWGTTCLTLATLVRPDGILALFVGAVLFISVEKKLPLKQIAISAVTLGAFALLALSFYGYVLPPTMEAKQAQVASGNWQTFSEKLPSLLYWYTPTIQPEWKGWLALLVFGAFLVLLRSLKGNVWKCQFAVFVWAILQVGFYHFQAISYYGWYLVPITVAAYLCVGSLFETVLDYCLSEKFAKATFIALLCYGLYRATQWAYNNTVYILVNGELPTSTMSVSLILLGILVLVTLYAGRRHITSGLCWLRDIQNKKLIPFGVAVGAYCLFGLYPYLNTQTALLSKTIPSKDFMQVEAAKRYETVGRYIESNRIKDVAHVEIGIIGWFAPSTRIVDPLGLGSPVDLVSIKHSNYLRVLLEKKPSAIVDMDNSRKELYIAEKEDEKIILRNIRRWQKLVEGEYRSGIVLLPEPSLKASQRMVLKRFNTTVWVR